MYFPYLRGKQEEQLAVIQSNSIVYSQNKVLPIFEPCALKKNNINRYVQMCKKGIPFVIIVNPQVGERPIPTPTQVMEMINNELSAYSNFVVGYIVDSNTQQNRIQNFVNAFPNHQKAIIHEGQFAQVNFFQTINTNITYHIFRDERVNQQYASTAGTGTNMVLLRDGFNKQARNSDYRGTEHFSDLYRTYSSSGYYGFGDYQSIGFPFAVGGGPANAVAIHLTYKNGNAVHVEHFVSTNRADTAAMFLQALNSLIGAVNQVPSRFVNTSGVDDFIDYHGRQHFPNLGPVKRSSIKHHLELVASLI
jgi:hypothetical protein